MEEAVAWAREGHFRGNGACKQSRVFSVPGKHWTEKQHLETEKGTGLEGVEGEKASTHTQFTNTSTCHITEHTDLSSSPQIQGERRQVRTNMNNPSSKNKMSADF